MAGTSDFRSRWFCGENASVVEDTQLRIYSDYCTANLFSACVHITFLVLFCAVLFLLGCCTKLRYYHPKSLIQFPGHYIRWTILSTLGIVLLGAVGEGVLTDVTRNPETKPNLYVPDSAALINVIIALVYYHHLECWNKPRLAWLLFIYWILAAAGEILRFISLTYSVDFTVEILKFDLLVLTILLYSGCLLIEINLLRSKVFGWCYHDKPYPRDLRKKAMYYNYEYTNIMSQVTYWSLNWLFVLGYKRPLEISDLGCLPEEYEAHYQYNLFNKAYETEKKRAIQKKRAVSLWRTYSIAYGCEMLKTTLWTLLSSTFGFIPAIAVGGVVAYATDWHYGSIQVYDTPMVTVTEYFRNGFVLVGVIFIASVLRAFTLAYGGNIGVMTAIKVKAALQTLAYEKALHLSTSSLSSGETSTGQIMNHMSVDATALFYIFYWFIFLVSIPYRAVVVLILLYWQLGLASLIGSSIFLFVTPLQYAITEIMAKVQRYVLLISDQRLKLSNEVLMGIKLLKLCGWEKMFCTKIEELREKEVVQMIKASVYIIVTNFVAQSVPVVLTFISFAVYTLINPDPLTPEVAFASLALFNQLVWPLSTLPSCVSYLVNALAGTRRLRTFFASAELAESESGREPLSRGFENAMSDDDGDDDNGEADDVDDFMSMFDNPGSDEGATVKLVKDGSSYKRKCPKRYGTFERNESTEDNEDLRECDDSVPDDIGVQIKNGNFTWESDSTKPTLRDINVEIPNGKLTMVAGLVGSGKTSLLSAMLEEIEVISGTVKFNRNRSSVSYVPQKPWLQNASFKDNILFGNDMNFKRYRKVIEVCALQPDIDILPGGDMTEIGEKGINLSGGQKQRVSLARALYSNSALVIMDDPLSALDVHVGSHIMERGIMNFLMKEGRTVILVTHQVQYLKYADKVIIMEDGRVINQGNPNEIGNQDLELFHSLREQIQLISESEKESESDLEKTLSLDREELKKQVSLIEESERNEGPGASLIEKEERERGSVSWSIYYVYAKAIKLPLSAFILLLFLGQGVVQIMTNFWLADWSESGVGVNNKTQEELDEELSFYLGGYGLLSLFYILLALAATSFHIILSLLAAKRLHINLLRNIIQAPMRFFDTTPTGRILNRLSNDTQMIDQRLWLTIFTLLTSALQCISAIVVNAVVTPVFMIVVIPVIILYLLVMKYFITTSRELKRLESISNSPVFSHLSETLSGVTTIRAYRHDNRFRRHFLERMDVNILTQLYLNPGNRWNGIRLEGIGALIMLISGLSSLLSCVLGDLEPSMVGLAITYSLNISGYLTAFVRVMGDCEMQMNAVERVDYYTKVKTEEYRGLYKPPSDWPKEGNVEFRNVSVRYSAELDPVLQDLNIQIHGGDKIGICGRTGSGKSSLTLALFRMIDTFEGCISIDGVNIADVPLLTLRSRLAIIPQDPVLFAGTIRFNLDPEEIRSDDELWEALDIAQLKQTVLDLDEHLDAEVTEEGSNFSVGQRQLFCLARAFLRKARILVMDEATASVDMHTDAILRNVIQTAFADRTVLTIAHRIATIVDSDMVLVLSEGKVIEYDSPQNLLSRQDSAFFSLVNQTTS
ncbi:ATP-binding cassette sub-family C member 8-like [Ptychodera flava]|uniref:ATP-binding cassette sub-family C member 8-like n=1 Tax=Ptychodera flava TaxID=63121 RepID=UPI00396A8096